MLWLIVIVTILLVIIFLFSRYGKESEMEGTPFTFTNDWGTYKAEFFIKDDTIVPAPTVIFVHGFLARYAFYDWIFEALVDAGYAVAAFNVPGTFVIDPKQWSEGFSSCIDYITTQAPFKDMVDPERIGIMGHSMGGLGTVWALVDEPRVKCGIPLSAAVSVFIDALPFELRRQFPQTTGLAVLPKPPGSSLTKPVQFQHGTLDGMCPFPGVEEYFSEVASANKDLLGIVGANHLQFLDLDMPDQIPIIDNPPEIPHEEVHEISKTNFLSWFDTHLHREPPTPPPPDEVVSLALLGVGATAGLALTFIVLKTLFKPA